MTAPRLTDWTFTEHTFVCDVCGDTCRAAVEAIAQLREDADCDSMTDAQVAAGLGFCLRCAVGVDLAGERVG
jgi:hypothetical protein